MALGLREMRAQLDWSQERLARELEVSAKTIARWEKGNPPKVVLMFLETQLKSKLSLVQEAAI